MFADHYFLLAGDELAFRWINDGGIKYTILQREEVINGVDRNDGNIVILGTVCPFSKEIVPPYYRGLIVRFSIEGEEE